MRTPMIRVSDSARRTLQEAAVEGGGDPLRIQISDRFEYDLCFGSRAESDLEVDCGGITILLDPSTAQRADGLSIDVVAGPEGSGFKIENPNEPPRVRQLSAAELKAMIDRGLPFVLVDVRTEEERVVAKIDGSRLLNEEGHDTLLAPKRHAAAAKSFTDDDRKALFGLLEQQAHRSPADAGAYEALRFPSDTDVPGAVDAYARVLNVPTTQGSKKEAPLPRAIPT